MIKITVFIHYITVKEYLSLEEMLRRIKSGHYGQWVRPVRRMLLDGDQKGYADGKKNLDAFAVVGVLKGGRKAKYIVEYSHLVVLDIDGLSEDELDRVKSRIILCDYTLACFISPSGRGLKIIVCVSTGPDQHLKAFLGLQQFYSTLTGVKIDPSGKDIARLCFVSVDHDLYYNPAARIFTPLSSEEETCPSVKPIVPVIKGTKAMVQKPVMQPASTDTIETYKRCIAQVERYNTYIEGERNEFLFALARKMKIAGLTEEFTVMMLMQDYDLGDREVRSCIKSAYSFSPAAPVKATAELVESTDTFDKPDPPSTEPSPEQPKSEKKSGSQKFSLKKVEKLLDQSFDMHYNEVTGMIEYRYKSTKKPFQRLEDYDENSMFRMLLHDGQNIPLGTLHALLYSNYSRTYNPFRAYFKKLAKWDGVTDYIGQLCATVKTLDDDYWAFCMRKWFVAYAMSLIVDEVINHTVIVFVGAQGVGKTSWMKLLLPKDIRNYVGTATLHTDSKDTSIQLAECALVILDEMEGLNRKDLASFKELITQPIIHIRKPYGRNSENLVRRASFAAAVNHDKVLTDPTGSRRYLCAVVLSMDYQHTVDMDGCMAQALALYKSGFKFWFDQSEIKALTSRNENFMSKSVVEELIQLWLRVITHEEWNTKNQFANGRNFKAMSATLIAAFLMEKAKFNLNDGVVVQIGKIMNKMGFEHIKRGNNHFYIMQIIDSEAVEKGINTPVDPEGQEKEQEDNERIIRLEEDLFNSNDDDGLPF